MPVKPRVSLDAPVTVSREPGFERYSKEPAPRCTGYVVRVATSPGGGALRIQRGDLARILGHAAGRHAGLEEFTREVSSFAVALAGEQPGSAAVLPRHHYQASADRTVHLSPGPHARGRQASSAQRVRLRAARPRAHDVGQLAHPVANAGLRSSVMRRLPDRSRCPATTASFRPGARRRPPRSRCSTRAEQAGPAARWSRRRLVLEHPVRRSPGCPRRRAPSPRCSLSPERAGPRPVLAWLRRVRRLPASELVPGLGSGQPFLVSSTISSRWNSSIAPRMLKTSRPVGVVVSMSCLSTFSPMPRSPAGRRPREQVLERPHSPGQPGDHQHVTPRGKPAPCRVLAARRAPAHTAVGKDLVAAVRGQLVDLAVVALAAGADPGVSDLAHQSAPLSVGCQQDYIIAETVPKTSRC